MLKVTLTPAWSIGRDEPEPLPPDVLTLLENVRELGSLQQAANAAGLSYRHAWGLMQHWEQVTGHKLILLERGRGATLSPFGDKLLQVITLSADEIRPALDRVGLRVSQDLDMAGALALPKLSVFASHDLALLKLRESLPPAESAALELKFQGSLDNVIALSKGKCEVAGFHVMTGTDAETSLAPFTTHLKPRLHALIHFVTRVQGLMVMPGNPTRIRGLADLRGAPVRFINRQPGSGTRLLFDDLLARAGIEHGQINGYHNEEFTHLAVAATVASDMADVGFGLAAAAQLNHLDFIPLVTERYLFACRRDQLNHPTLGRLRQQMKDTKFRADVRALAGYDPENAGDLASLIADN
jgi:molybdate transport repressor ModE-like protein